MKAVRSKHRSSSRLRENFTTPRWTVRHTHFIIKAKIEEWKICVKLKAKTKHGLWRFLDASCTCIQSCKLWRKGPPTWMEIAKHLISISERRVHLLARIYRSRLIRMRPHTLRAVQIRIRPWFAVIYERYFEAIFTAWLLRSHNSL